MAPRPYSDRSVLPRDSSNSSVSVESDIVQMTADSSPGNLSSATTPSPVEQEILSDINANTSEIEEDDYDILHSNAAFYPTPADSMPFDHAFPDFIRQLTNERNLANVYSLRLRVISRLVSLQRVSLFTTNLRELDLEGSILGSLRDIGCNLKLLQVLKVGNCRLDSLDGTFGLTSLRKLYAQRNMITDVSPCSNLPHIQHIDVSHNRIRNIGYAGFLSVCRKLKTIVFAGNPAAQLQDYREHVRRMLPQLESLDDVTFSEDERGPSEGVLDDFYDMSEEDQVNFYCNTFEKEEESESTKSDEMKIQSDLSRDHDTEIQEIRKYSESKGFHGRDLNLLSLRKERDENKQVPGSRHGRGVNVNYEEMEDIVQNCPITNWSQCGDSYDDFTLPPLSVSEKEMKKTANTGEMDVLLAKEKLKSKTKEGTGSPAIGSDLEIAEIPDFESMGARPRAICKMDRPSTASTNTISSNHLRETERVETRRPCTAGSNTLTYESSVSNEKLRRSTGQANLTSGLPICGNLTVALRNRKKKQEMEENDNNLFKGEYEVPELNRTE